MVTMNPRLFCSLISAMTTKTAQLATFFPSLTVYQILSLRSKDIDKYLTDELAV